MLDYSITLTKWATLAVGDSSGPTRSHCARSPTAKITVSIWDGVVDSAARAIEITHSKARTVRANGLAFAILESVIIFLGNGLSWTGIDG